MKKTWYKILESPYFIIVIAFISVFSPFAVRLVLGVLLAALKAGHEINIHELKDSFEKLKTEYETQVLHQDESLEYEFNKKYNELSDKFDIMRSKYDKEISELQIKKSEYDNEISQLKNEINMLEGQAMVSAYNFSDYAAISSEECRNRLSMLKINEQEIIKSFLESHSKAPKTYKNNIKQIIRCFNAETDNIMLNLTVKSIESCRNKVIKSFESLNKIFETDDIVINKKLLKYKLEELNLVYTAQLKREEETATRKVIREQMLEEEKVRREIEREKAKLDKETAQFQAEVSKLMSYMQKATSDIDKQLYADKIKELDEKIKDIEIIKQDVLNREQNTRAGFVYIISNIGSFGEDVYKIGMTRRLEPMDRINELSGASVPFPFDVHAMIFSEDAPALETILHQYFKNWGKEINKVNPRKEFFQVNIKVIKELVKENHNATVVFTDILDASQYRRSLELAKALITEDDLVI
ncbi:MAG: DUF4041 domain-containing protein [Clostridiales bacterium]|nr:DUF4041 domain-containing protein [Clostridiales bacterium]